MNPKSKKQLIDWLFNMIGTDHFNMSSVVGSKLYECGTTLCLLGAAESLASHQDILSESLAKIDCHEYIDQLEAFYNHDDYDGLIYERALKWLGFNTSTDWKKYHLFFSEEWPQPYQRIYWGCSNICEYVVNSKDVCCCKSFYRPLAGILLLTDMPDDKDGYLDGMECNDNESFYKRHEDLIQRCISKFRTTL